MKEQIETLVNRLESEINKTPTSELRNLLTDANVLLQALSIHVVSQQREPLIAFAEDWNTKNDTDQVEITEDDIDDYLEINCG